MTNDQIMQIAARHNAYADCTPTLRGDAILAFARELLALVQRPTSGTWSIDADTGFIVVHE